MELKKFEVGKTYWHGWAKGSRITCWTVEKRTPKTITIVCRAFGDSETKTCRINGKLSEWSGAECVRPYGSYSMAPCLEASNCCE